MTKRERYEAELRPLLEAALTSHLRGLVTDYLLQRCNLPGPRANLELVAAFADSCAALAENAPLWQLLIDLASVDATQAPAGDPGEFLPVCAAVGLGAAAADRFLLALDALRPLARDPRWRIREGVCFGLQRLLGARPRETTAVLRQWVAGGDLMEMRAVVAAVADPPLLKDPMLVLDSLDLHRAVLDRFVRAVERRSEPARVLRQGLAYTVSVVAAAAPEPGFALLRELVESSDSDLVWIARQNLKRNRLRKPHPELVNDLEKRLPS